MKKKKKGMKGCMKMMRKRKTRELSWHLYKLQVDGSSQVCACATERQPGFGDVVGVYSSKDECEKARKERHLLG